MITTQTIETMTPMINIKPIFSDYDGYFGEYDPDKKVRVMVFLDDEVDGECTPIFSKEESKELKNTKEYKNLSNIVNNIF